MKKYLLIIPITIALGIFFYPTTSNSNAAGSEGGKTGSPTDGASCTGCHYAGVGTGATITSDIPSSGYIPGDLYTITANINQSGISKFGFEITSEEANFGSAKKGTFFVTNSTETQPVNNNTAITHTAGGTSGSDSKSWSMNWEAPNTGTGDITFYGSFIAANGNGNNMGDTYHPATYTVNEGVVNKKRVINAKVLNTRNSSVTLDSSGLDNIKFRSKAKETKNEVFYCAYRRLNQGVLLPNGEVSLCCQDYKLEYILGNLKKQNLNNLYHKIQDSKVDREHFISGSFFPCISCEHYRPISNEFTGHLLPPVS